MQTAGMRNENAAVNRIDFNAIKEANTRVGANITIVTEPRVDTGYFAAEFGRPAGGAPVLAAPSKVTAWHGESFWTHQNSVFNARTFFQVGGVKPSRRNSYGARVTGELTKSTWLTAIVSQQKIRGMVNGNVLVPLADERTPLTTDPALRALVTRFLNAYPAELPNRPDFDARALNTNAPQRIDDIDGTLRLDRDLARWGKLAASHQLTRQRVDAFQLVAGQNPDNEIHTHRSQLTWRTGSAAGIEAALGFTFSRNKTVLVAEPNAMPSRIRMGFQIEELGPDSEFPVNRATNSFRYGAVLSRRLAGDKHQLTWGGDLTRFQLNGIETLSTRGYFSFTNNFGRSAIQNLRMGEPSFYEVTTGELARGFRNWTTNAFIADRWKLSRRVQLTLGLRYNAVTGPTEANRIHPRLYPCDCNNLSPRFSLAVQAFKGWMMRTGYTVSFGEIPPVTYQQIRFNLPEVQYVQLQNPRLINPLAGLNLASGSLRSSPTILSPEIVSPYAHQYHFSLERKSRNGALVRLGYTGSQSVKLINGYVLNRAQVVPGIPLTLDTVDRRRADPHFYEVRYVLNGGRGNFNAAQASLDLPDWRGLRGALSYTFSKSIDDGPDYTSTAANRDMSRARSQSQYESFGDRRGLSAFDSPHALIANFSYDLPSPTAANSWPGKLANGWQLAGVSMLKSGTPLTLFIGSDAPGFGNVDGSASDRPNVLYPAILGSTVSHPDMATTMLARDRFSYITPGALRGNLGKNTLRKARIANLNAALSRQFHLLGGGGREWRAQFRAEVYNLTNTPQFDEPQRNLSSPAFGKITNALNDGRVFQLALRFLL